MRREQALNSSAITSAGYDDETKEMDITFSGGSSYTFHSVPAEIFDGLISAGSAGQYYHQNIKGQYV